MRSVRMAELLKAALRRYPQRDVLCCMELRVRCAGVGRSNRREGPHSRRRPREGHDLVSGFNVYPNEIEQVVCLHPGMLKCVACGNPDERSREAVKLFVVKGDPPFSEDDIAIHCRENFTAHRHLKYIEFREELPKSNVGEISRRELRSARCCCCGSVVEKQKRPSR